MAFGQHVAQQVLPFGGSSNAQQQRGSLVTSEPQCTTPLRSEVRSKPRNQYLLRRILQVYRSYRGGQLAFGRGLKELQERPLWELLGGLPGGLLLLL